MKLETGNLKLKIAALLLGVLGVMAVHATPFYQYFYNPDGTAQTNSFTMTAYPPVNTWTIVGTNIYYGAYSVTFTPNSSGYVSNQIAPNVYSVLFSNLNSGFYVNIPNTTNVAALASYATNAPTIAGTVFNSFGMITNWLNYWPATNTPAGIIGALGYTPQSNSPAFTPPANPTNQFSLNTLYTNTVKGLLIGYASGTILHWTNNSSPFVLPITNDFCVPLSTNDTFKFDNSGSLTNATFWPL